MLVETDHRLEATVDDRGDLAATAMLVAGAFLVVGLVVPVFVLDTKIGLAMVFGLVLFAVVVAEPVRAAYAFLLLTPLAAGFERGSVLPVLRPSEALLGLLLAAVATRHLADGLTGRLPPYEITVFDRVIVLMAVLSSVVPLFWRVGRGFSPQMDDILFATTLWKYLLVFALFRVVVRSQDEVYRCLQAMLTVGVVVAVVAILQSLGAGPVPRILAQVYGEPLESIDNNRGSSTLGTSHGVADVMAFDLAIAVAFLMKGIGRRRINMALAGLFGLACFASGQVSAIFAIVVAVVALGVYGRRVWATLRVAVPGVIVSLVILQPVLQARLAHTNESGVPSSWDARKYNLTNYFWPELFSGLNWVLGVRPAGRLPSYEPWREWVYIESGHTWLLWTGGVPFFLAYLWFSWATIRPAQFLAKRPGVPGALGLAAATALWVVFVLMSLDVHLTMRGPADALFPILALMTVPAVWAGCSDARQRFLNGGGP